jgi:hypothetical protein
MKYSSVVGERFECTPSLTMLAQEEAALEMGELVCRSK